MSELEEGFIPKGKECPWKNQCAIFLEGFCKHTGGYNFSCASARGFDICNVPTDKELCDE